MTPAPDTGRTAEEMREFRKALALACNDPGHFVGFKGERSLGEWQVDALLAGPLAPVLAEIAQLRERLEITHAYDGAGNKVPFPKDMEHLDGIACRDETIKQQDEQIAQLRSRLLEAEMGGEAMRGAGTPGGAA